ncbi:MAG: DNA-3-methyladenine glycosylase 2 family protein [Pseudomonadota bacterium]
MTQHEMLDVFGDVSAPCGVLRRRDKGLKTALAAIGAPHVRRRKGGFEGLFRIIVEQQVSVQSAQAIWARCRNGLPALRASAVLDAGEADLKSFGLSGPKARYVMALAEAAHAKRFVFSRLKRLSDAEAVEALVALKGIGPWSAGIYLLFCEGRADIWPPGDVALMSAYQAAAGLPDRPSAEALDDVSAGWAPYRGLAAHILWTYYAYLRGRTPI